MARQASPPPWRNRIVGHGVKPAKEFLANPDNWRLHPQAQADAVQGSIDELGWIDEVMENVQTGHVIDGHERIVLALRKGDDTPVPYTSVDLSPEEEKIALAVFDPITSMAAADKQKLDALLRDVMPQDAALQQMLSELAAREGLYTGNGTPTLDDVPPAQVDRADELQGHWQTSLGQLWEIPSLTVPGKSHRLLCGDCTKREDVARLLEDRYALLCFTSPPYAHLREYGQSDLSVKHLASFIQATLGYVEIYAVNLGIVRKDGQLLRYWDEYIAAAEMSGLKLLSWNVWHQGVGGSVGDLTAMFPLEHEFIFVFGERRVDLNRTIKTKRPGMNTSVSDRQFDGSTERKSPVMVQSLRRMGTVVVTPAEKHHSDEIENLHPARFPVRLVADYIDAISQTEDIILDPFLGSGTTMVAAEQICRVCYGCDIEPKYVAVTLQRLQDSGLQPRLVEPSCLVPEPMKLHEQVNACGYEGIPSHR